MNNLQIGDIVTANNNVYNKTSKSNGWKGIVTSIIIDDDTNPLFNAKTIFPLEDFGNQYFALGGENFDILYKAKPKEFEVGDIVRVKTIGDIDASAAHSYEDGYYLGKDGVYFNREMSILCGRKCRIIEKNVIAYNSMGYILQDDLSGHRMKQNYTSWMFTKEEEDDD